MDFHSIVSVEWNLCARLFVCFFSTRYLQNQWG